MASMVSKDQNQAQDENFLSKYLRFSSFEEVITITDIFKAGKSKSLFPCRIRHPPCQIFESCQKRNLTPLVITK